MCMYCTLCLQCVLVCYLERSSIIYPITNSWNCQEVIRAERTRAGINTRIVPAPPRTRVHSCGQTGRGSVLCALSTVPSRTRPLRICRPTRQSRVSSHRIASRRASSRLVSSKRSISTATAPRDVNIDSADWGSNSINSHSLKHAAACLRAARDCRLLQPPNQIRAFLRSILTDIRGTDALIKWRICWLARLLQWWF